MLDKLYSDIGAKIKRWAKWLFICEAVGTVIAGIAIVISLGFEYALWALFIIIFGPIVALVSSWILYAFGQLVEDVHEITPKKAKEEHQKSDPEIARTLPHKPLSEFRILIREMRTDDLEMILENEKRLYSSDEIKIIKVELDYRYG